MRFVVLLIVVSTVAVFVLQRFIVRLATKARTTERVLADGKPTTAVVLDTYDTGSRVNTIYVMVRLTLRIEDAEGVPGFETTTVAPISPVKLPDFAIGRTIKVRVDPATKDVAMDQPQR